MIWDNHRDTNFGVFLVIGTVFVIAFYYRNTFLSVIDKKVESKFQAEINKIRAEQRNAEYNEVNGIN